ncbi:MAG: hypothetical protein H0W04_03655 [Chthoniobacterales bacterium]|nr:hypothetical protein [Chthoniobacterales bacterium]
MKTQTTTSEQFESTYALILRSEEKERGVSEALIYLLLILSAVFSIWQVARQPFQLPTGSIMRNAPIAHTADTQPAARDA